MFYCTLRDLVLYLHKDEHGFRKNQMSDNVHNAIRIHHALATKASDYTKKQHVFRLQTADQSEYLFQVGTHQIHVSPLTKITLKLIRFSDERFEGAAVVDRHDQLCVRVVFGAPARGWRRQPEALPAATAALHAHQAAAGE